MTGLHVVRVDVHVQGVSFEKENKEAQAGLDSADLPKIGSGKPDAKVKPNRSLGKVTIEETPEPEPKETVMEPSTQEPVETIVEAPKEKAEAEARV